MTSAAIFLVVRIRDDEVALDITRGLLADLSGLLRSVGFRSASGQLSCVTGIGSDIWDRLFPAGPRPRELHPFQEVDGVHRAVSTPGDLLFHIRAMRMDLCFELARLVMERLGDAAAVADEVHGFRYFDQRDLLGFVDGTENPTDQDAIHATLIGDEDPGFAGGSYVVVQKYLHDLAGWNALPTEVQEKIVGRRKLSDVELGDDEKPSYAHNALTVITEDGEEDDIVRSNMPFGDIGSGEFGTYFIGYSRAPRRIERMIRNMFIGDPVGNYDRILDFSKAVTGSLFFIPTRAFLDGIGADAPEAPARANDTPQSPRPDGSLGIGSLKQGENA